MQRLNRAKKLNERKSRKEEKSRLEGAAFEFRRQHKSTGVMVTCTRTCTLLLSVYDESAMGCTVSSNDESGERATTLNKACKCKLVGLPEPTLERDGPTNGKSVELSIERLTFQLNSTRISRGI